MSGIAVLVALTEIDACPVLELALADEKVLPCCWHLAMYHESYPGSVLDAQRHNFSTNQLLIFSAHRHAL